MRVALIICNFKAALWTLGTDGTDTPLIHRYARACAQYGR